MTIVTMRGNAVKTVGSLPDKGKIAPNFNLVKTDLSTVTLNDYKGHKVVMNIFPSVDTGVCATSVRKFNEKATALENTKVLCISKDLPFAFSRFCGAEGLDNVDCLSDFRNGSFGNSYGVTMEEGPFKGLHSRAVVVLDENGDILYTQQVASISDEPDYEEALKHI